MSDATTPGSAGALAGRAEGAATDGLPPFICGTCGKRYPAVGDCPDCPGSALLDLRKPTVLEMLEEFDDRAKRNRDQRWLWVGVVVGVVVVGFLNLQSFWQVVRRSTIVLPFFLDQIILMSLVAAGVQRLLLKLFPSRRVLPRALTPGAPK
jgi:hypothetical protein